MSYLFRNRDSGGFSDRIGRDTWDSFRHIRNAEVSLDTARDKTPHYWLQLSTVVRIHVPGPSEAEPPRSPGEPCGRRRFSPAARFSIRWSIVLLLASVLIVLCSARAVAAADDRPGLQQPAPKSAHQYARRGSHIIAVLPGILSPLYRVDPTGRRAPAIVEPATAAGIDHCIVQLSLGCQTRCGRSSG